MDSRYVQFTISQPLSKGNRVKLLDQCCHSEIFYTSIGVINVQYSKILYLLCFDVEYLFHRSIYKSTAKVFDSRSPSKECPS